MIARPAVPADAPELVRLRAVLLNTMGGEGSDDWREPSRQILVAELGAAAPAMAAFVVDRPDDDGLAASAIGVIQQRLGHPGDPAGRSGYIFSVATDPQYRRRGYSRACVTAVLDWFREQGIRRVELRASAEGEPLYRSLGFTEGGDPALRLRLY
jgi:ribosomal protein S18 acetylase RimI-like enzyme